MPSVRQQENFNPCAPFRLEPRDAAVAARVGGAFEHAVGMANQRVGAAHGLVAIAENLDLVPAAAQFVNELRRKPRFKL